MKSTVLTSYRSLLREVKKLPYPYLRIFFREKSRDDAIFALRSPFGIRRLEKSRKRLRKAIAGNRKSFSKVLDNAFGRVGKLKWELMEPFILSSKEKQKDSRILIRGIERSRLPAYSNELLALLTSPYSRTTKALRPAQLDNPPTLFPRFDPTTEDAKLFGPLGKRREVNIRWRYFSEQTKRLLPPFEVTTVLANDPRGSDELSRKGVDGGGIVPTEGGFQGTGLLEKLEEVARSPRHTPEPRRARRLAGEVGAINYTNADGTSPSMLSAVLPTRFLRRRHQELLGFLPKLIGTSFKEAKSPSSVRFSVALSRSAISPHLRGTIFRTPIVDKTNWSWIRFAPHKTSL